MGDSLSYPEDDDISRYGQNFIRPQNALGVATSADGRFGGRVGNGGIEETEKIVLQSIQRLVTAVMYGDERAVENASEDVQIAVNDLEEEVENAADEGDKETLSEIDKQLAELDELIAQLQNGAPTAPPVPEKLRRMYAPTAKAKYIGGKDERDSYREDIKKKQDKIIRCRNEIYKARRQISRLKKMITKDKRMERKENIKKGATAAYERFYEAVKPSESKIPSVGGTLKAEGTLPVGDRLSDGSKGSAFFHSIIGCEDKEDFEHEFNIANRFFKKQYGLDFSDENPEVVKDGLKRTIGDVVTMEPFGMNHNITHKVETANMHIGELSPAGSDVYDGGFKVEVKQPIELGGNFEREAEDAVVPAGTKMLHGYMDLMDASGDNSAVRIAYRTKQPIVASGGNTYSMVGNLVSHEAPKFAIKRTLYVNKKGGDNHVVMATEFGH